MINAQPDRFVDRFINEKEYAEIRGCSRAKLQRDRWDGSGVPFYKLDGHVRYKLSEVLAWIETRRCTSTSQAPES